MESVYLDHAATTPLHPDVFTAMLPYYKEVFGNPSSLHRYGQLAKIALDQSREKVAKCLGATPGEIIFTGGGTESDNLALVGVMEAFGQGHLITSQIEHHAILHTCDYLAGRGFEITYLPVGKNGKVDPEDLRQAIRPDTRLISIMFGNNETGIKQPIYELGNIAREHGVYFHTDGVQAVGLESFQLNELPIDLMSLSAHKINGPKGVGALYIAKGVKIASHIHGGSQEKKKRAGTENVPGIVGLAKALEIVTANKESLWGKYLCFKSIMVETWKKDGLNFTVNNIEEDCLPHILNVSFPNVKRETLLMNLDLQGIAASGGSACTAGSLQPSHVLQAMGLEEDCVDSAIRFSFGFGNTDEEIQQAAEKIARIVQRLNK
ncbi:MAG TPA: cysteine desulfurase NifS [Paenibacillaceae bacterium]|nr:cysteine desulfurase NifS [Paenibacillaceae bacterium]